jgi:bHLH factor
MRRDNHKEVERRRRETINEGINDIAKMVPNSDKNKGSILRQAVKYIQMIVAENERMQADSDALVTAKFELDKAILEKNVAEATYQTINVQYEQLKRDYEELRKKMDELGDEQAAKKQRID